VELRFPSGIGGLPHPPELRTIMPKSSPLVGYLALWLVAAVAAHGATIVSDSFNDSPPGPFNSVALNGTTPNINLPGNTWTVTGSGAAFERPAESFLGSPTPFGFAGPVSHLFLNSVRATIGLGEQKAGLLTISAYLSPTITAGPLQLGFATESADSATYQFFGLNLYNNGDLQTTYDGVTSAVVPYAGGAFSPSTTAYQLAFTVDTVTGALLAITLSGSTANYSTLFGGSAFTPAATGYASLGSAGGGFYMHLVVVPEPSAAVLLGLGGVGLFSARRWPQKFRLPRQS